MKTMRILSMAALALVGAVMTGCSSDDNIIVTPQQPANKVVTVKTTVSLGDGVATRALDIDFTNKKATKTFAVGDKISVFYQQTNDDMYEALSDALQVGDITNDGKTATFTVTLENPKDGGEVYYGYPGVENGCDFYDGQDGSFDTFQSQFDSAFSAESTMTVSGENVTLPGLTLENDMAVLVLTLKDADGTNTTTSNLNQVIINIDQGWVDTYNITPKGDTFGTDKIYVAINPSDDATITVTASDGTKIYTKTLTNKTYEAGNIYNLGWRMAETPAPTIDLSTVSSNTAVYNGSTLTGTLEAEYVKISIAKGATVTLNGVSINATGKWTSGDAGITCLGNATIILSGSNIVKGFYEEYPGISVPEGKTLTIQGSGSLTASSNGWGAGIGGGFRKNCGNIVIEGGTITATGGKYAAGIGGGEYASCGYITIGNGITSITAIKGESAYDPIGRGYGGTCGTVTIDGTTSWTAGTATTNLNFNVSTTNNTNDTWTLTHK